MKGWHLLLLLLAVIAVQVWSMSDMTREQRRDLLEATTWGICR